MTDDEYKEVQDSIALVSSAVEQLPLEAFLERAERCAAVGAAMEPGLFAKAWPRLKLITDTARHLRAVQELNAAARLAGVVP